MYGDACFFSGHRRLPLETRPGLIYLICHTIEDLLSQGVVNYYCGGAMGFDQLAAEAVLDMKNAHPELRLLLALPYPGHADRWPEETRMRFEQMAGRADEVLAISPRYHAACMHQRNEYMVNHADYGMYYLTSSAGGTASTVAYARRKNRILKNLAAELKNTPYPPDEVLRMLRRDPDELELMF